MSTDPRVAALAVAMTKVSRAGGGRIKWDSGAGSIAAAILAALPADWCGHGTGETWFPIVERWRGIAEANGAEIIRLRASIEDSANGSGCRASAMEATIARLRTIEEAAREHGECTCRYYPGYPRGDRHAPECDNDPELRAALEAGR